MNAERKSSQKIPSLYHYTTQNGLIGIIEKRSLWFTNIFYLNDASEYRYTYDLVEEELNKKEQNIARRFKYPDEFLINRFLKDNLEFWDLSDYVVDFVFSFTEKPDLLSQWRGYCGNESGYCIEFDYEKIIKFARYKDFKLEECIYEDEEQRKLIKDKIEEVYKYCKDASFIEILKKPKGLLSQMANTDEENERLNNIRRLFLLGFIKYAPIFKHPTFYQEREWRMFRPFKKSTKVKTKFRSGKSMLIPYKDIQIAECGEKMPIKRIIVGPTNQPKLSKNAVIDLLMANSIKFCSVELSKIPYRN
jgi:Protein of unknown function (DUF2971)